MRDERFDRLVQVLDLNSSYNSQNNQARQLVLELALENAALTAKLSAIAEYEGLSYEADQPIPFKLTPKGEAVVLAKDFPKMDMDPAVARMVMPNSIPESALAAPPAAADVEEAL